MPDLSPTTKLLQGFTNVIDSGYLKQTDGEYAYLQNVRGWGGMGQKRRGMQTSHTFSAGIMGWLDLKIQDDPNTPDLVVFLTQDGSLTTLTIADLFATIIQTHAIAIPLYGQSPDGNWWDITPDTSTGIISPTIVATPAATITTDQVISYETLYGFSDTTGVWRLYVEDDGAMATKRYQPITGVITYSTARAFVTGKGLVFTASAGAQFRLTVTNDGELQTEVI